VTAVSVSPSQVHAQIAAIRAQRPDARVFGIHSTAAWTGANDLLVGADRFRVVPCQTALEAREALLRAEEDDAPLVIVTPLQDEDLEADVRARFARGRLLRIRSWEILQEMLELRDVDARLRDELWMGECLLEAAAAGLAPVVPTGFLDADTAWDIVGATLDLPSGRPDALDLLRWADAGGIEHYLRAGDPVQPALQKRVLETAGPAGPLILSCLASGPAADVVPLGLVCGVVFAADAQASSRIALERAAVRLERYCGNRPVSAAAGRAWAGAAETIVADLLAERGLGDARPALQRSDVLLREIEAAGEAHLGRFSPFGFDQRLEQLASALQAAAGAGAAGDRGSVADALARVSEHGLARWQPERVERCEMAVRLARWLARPAATASSFEEAALRYSAESGFVDWLRAALEAGDGCQPLSAAYAALLSRVAERREVENERFGRLLGDWAGAGATARDVLRVEDVLSRVLAPVAKSDPVLLLVVDGMSLAIYRQLARDLVGEGWIELAPAGRSPVSTVIAALPTITEVSRCSLLSGRLARGLAADEKAGFESNAELVAVTGRKKPPVLFHKAELGESGGTGLAGAVRTELADPDRRIVGLVVNAVDDHLAKGDQIRPRWGIEAIAPLRTALHAAQQAGRIVVLTSDHGHVPERGTESRAGGDAERWRAAAGDPGPGEVLLAGSRIVVAGERLIAPWTERLRYGAKKNGYHGGASPQEVVIPLGVFSPGVEVDGWSEVGEALPDWWSEDGRSATPAPRKGVRKKPRTPEKQADLFPAPAAPGTASGWVDALLVSAVWRAQLQSAGRVAGEVERFRLALAALDERGGKLTRQAMAQRLGLPPVRVAGFLAALRRVLNVDGYGVLEVDEASDTLTLNRELLRKQFELP